MTEEPTFPSGVSINLDRERRIKYGHNALCEFENAMGKPIGASLTSEEQIGFSTIRALLWAGLLGEDPTLSLEQAGSLIDYVPENEASEIHDRARYVADRCLLAFTAQHPKAKKKTRAKAQAS